MSVLESLYSDQFTLSTQLIIPNHPEYVLSVFFLFLKLTCGSFLKWSEIICMNLNCKIELFTGPGLKPPAENTLQYLEDIAIQSAK